MASFAAILAIGKPVALDARALDRETRGFISMTTTRPSAGFTANWMLHPPVSTPTERMMPIERSRRCWYSRSVNVMAGAAASQAPAGPARPGRPPPRGRGARGGGGAPPGGGGGGGGRAGVVGGGVAALRPAPP